MIGYRSRAFSRIPTGGNKDSNKGGIRASTKKPWNLANLKKPISRAIQYQGTFSDNHFFFANAVAALIPYTQF